MSGGWVTSLRIARREARKSKARSILVLAMIALPVAFLSFAAVTFDMFVLTPQESLERRLGTADARLSWVDNGPVRQEGAEGYGWSALGPEKAVAPQQPPSVTEANLLPLLPDRSRVTRISSGHTRLRTADGIEHLAARIIEVGDPLVKGVVDLVEGTPPRGPDQVAVNKNAARILQTGVGATIRTADPDRSLTVTAIVEFPDQLSELVAYPPAAAAAVQDIDSVPEWLVATPSPLTWEDVQRLNAHGIIVASRDVILNPPQDSGELLIVPSTGTMEGLAIGFLAGGLATLEIVLLAGPAFAVGARRRARDLALVAAAGGEPKHLRRIVLADGVVLGLTGAVTGIVIGVTLAAAGRGLIEEQLAFSRAGGWRFFPLALLAIALLAVGTGLLAAMVPAFIAARQDVVRVLTGQRGIVRSRLRWVMTGIVMIAAGTGIASWGALLVTEVLMLLGIVLAELGLVLITPGLLGLLARGGNWLPLAPRLALRDIARNRTAAAPAISAIMAAVAGAVAVGVFVTGTSRQQAEQYRPYLPLGHINIQHGGPIGAQPPDWGKVEAAAREVLPSAHLQPYLVPNCGVESAKDVCDIGVLLPEQLASFPGGAWLSGAVIDDGAGLKALTEADAADIAAAQQVLSRGGVVVNDPAFVAGDIVTIMLFNGPKEELLDLPSAQVPAYVMTTSTSAIRSIVSTGALAQLNIGAEKRGYVIDTDAPLTEQEQSRLNRALTEIDPNLYMIAEHGPTFQTDPIAIILALAAALIALGAAGIATGLATVDASRDLATLAAVGAAPAMRRRLSLSRAGVIAGLGALLGTVAGLGGAGVLIAALNRLYLSEFSMDSLVPFAVPWQSLAIIVAVPLVAMAGAGLFTRAGLPIERRF